MEMQSFLVIDHKEAFRSNGRTCYKSMVEGVQLYNIGVPIPLITHEGCSGVAVPYELHISEQGTIVFYTMVNDDVFTEKDRKAFYSLYMVSMGRQKSTYHQRQDRDTARTGMDAATRMMMGEERSARQIARGEQRDSKDKGPGIWEMMRRSNPGDPLFDEDDDY
jgi:hypothetical protein